MEDREKKEPDLQVCHKCGKQIDINKTSYGSTRDAEGNTLYHHLYQCTEPTE